MLRQAPPGRAGPVRRPCVGASLPRLVSASAPKPHRSVRNAAAVLLTRGRGPDLEVLLVERAPELRFFGGYLACPGGVRGPEDGEDLDGDDTSALAACAVREVFEELGPILLPEDLASADRIAATRARMLAAEGSSDEEVAAAARDAWIALRADLPPAAESMRTVCRIKTPPFAPVLYDTVFFHAEVAPGREPDIVRGELVGAVWQRPGQLLDRWRAGEILIVPPVLILLERLIDGDLAAFYARADEIAQHYRAGGLHHVRFSPGVLLAPLRTPTLPPATTTNTLILGTERLWIVDPATPDADEQERLFALLDELQAAGARLEGILLTHHHPDHVGAVEATSKRYGLPVRGHRITLDRVEGAWQRGETLEHGDRIPLGTAPDGTDDWSIEALFTPGHDQGHLCFQESRYGALVAGDMISTISTIVIDPPEGHLATYIASLELLAGRGIGTLYPAHGPAVRDGGRIVQHYIRHRRQRENSLLQALQENGPASARALTQKVYWDARPELLPLATRSLIAGLEKLEEEGRVIRQDGADAPRAIWALVV
jgi:ribonuclease/clavin/mitogillin